MNFVGELQPCSGGGGRGTQIMPWMTGWIKHVLGGASKSPRSV